MEINTQHPAADAAADARRRTRKPIVVVAGPTASGKSDLAEQIARSIDAEIVSSDSMQVYRGMDIGTAKVPIEERGVPYHCLDLVDPGEQFSAALYQRHARSAIEDIFNRGHSVVLCGGTGLYIQAALDDMRFPAGDQKDNPIREHYHALARENGVQWLYDELAKRDPASAEVIEPGNVRRVVRAFELLETGTTYAEQHKGLHTLDPYYEALYLGLTVDRDELVERIDRRVDQMLADGLAEEIKILLSGSLRDAVTSMQAIGYKEFVPLIEGGIDRSDPAWEQAADQVKTATRRYAKRQRTWFRREKRMVWLDAGTQNRATLYERAMTVVGDYLGRRTGCDNL